MPIAYGLAGAAWQVGAVTLVAVVVVAAVFVWTRPEREEVEAADPGADTDRAGAEAIRTPGPTVESAPLSVVSSATDPASALRQLKAIVASGSTATE